MNRLKILSLSLFVSVLLFGLTPIVAKAFSESDSPLILGVNRDLLVTGLVKENLEVLIYVNGNYVGNAEVNREQTGTDNFYYRIKSDLGKGTHTVSAVAKDRTSLRLSYFSDAVSFKIDSLPAPTLIQPNEKTVTGSVKPLVTGLSVSNTVVHIFIDGKHNGKTALLSHPSGTANFAYKPFLNLAPGWHTLWARAEDANGRVSPASKVMRFRIEEPLPAPIVINTVVDNNSSLEQPLITGLVKGDLKVRIFIDQHLNGEFYVSGNKAKAASFAYRPFLPLKPGKHMIYALAVDERGKESLWSNIIYYVVPVPVPAISEEGVAEEAEVREEREREDAVSDSDADEQDVSQNNDSDDPSNEAGDTDNAEIGSDIRDILEAGRDGTSTEGGLLNESEEQQGKLKLNLVIFILFLLAVIGWIFWVNRELIRERREQNEKDE
jgi:hypothetical protein